MVISFRQLKNLPVYTKNGDYLGKIKDLVINSQSHSVQEYRLQSSQMIAKLTGEDLIIKPGQVISLDQEKMVVEDNVVSEKEAGLVGETAPSA